MRIFSGLLAIVLGAAGLALAPSPAAAADLVLSPPKFEENVEPGDVLTKLVKITNRAPDDVVVSAEVQDFTARGEGGEADFVENSHTAQSLAQWIEFPQSTVAIPAGKTVQIPFTVRVPADAEPGGHYGSVFFTPPPIPGERGQTRVEIVQKLGSLVLLRVAGEVRESASLLDFDTFSPENPDGTELVGGELADARPTHFFQYLPVVFGARFENSGTVHVKPTGSIEIYNLFGQRVKRVAIADILNAAGLKTGEKIADAVPLNPGRGNVLPDSRRGFAEPWEGFAKFTFDEATGVRALEMTGFAIGRYRAVLRAKYGNSETDFPIAEVSFWVLPLREIGGGIAVLLILIGLAVWRRRTSRARLERLVAERMAAEKK